jgi:hypothetical protein
MNNGKLVEVGVAESLTCGSLEAETQPGEPYGYLQIMTKPESSMM